MAIGAFIWLRYVWSGFGGKVEDLNAHRKNGLMICHFTFLVLLIIICLLTALFA